MNLLFKFSCFCHKSRWFAIICCRQKIWCLDRYFFRVLKYDFIVLKKLLTHSWTVFIEEKKPLINSSFELLLLIIFEIIDPAIAIYIKYFIKSNSNNIIFHDLSNKTELNVICTHNKEKLQYIISMDPSRMYKHC